MTMQYTKMRLRCETPIFIGSGEEYTKMNYFYWDNRVYYLNEHAWASFLFKRKRNLLNKFTEENANAYRGYGPASSIRKFLSDQGVIPRWEGQGKDPVKFLSDIGVITKAEGIPLAGISDKNTGKYGPNTIHSFIRDGRGARFIPGSSLKGAMRTAILSEYLRQNRKFGRYWKDLERVVNPHSKATKKDSGNVFKNLEKEIAIPFNEKTRRRDMVDSYFTGMQVSDAVLENEHVGIVQKDDLGYSKARKGYDPNPLVLFREALMPPTSAEFTVGIDPKKMGSLGIRNIDDLMNCLQKFMSYQYDILSDAFPADNTVYDLDSIRRSDLYLGGGTGFLSKTLVYSLAPSKDEAIRVTRQILQSMFGKHNHDFQISPRTLKLTKVQSQYDIMGLGKLEVVDKQ